MKTWILKWVKYYQFLSPIWVPIFLTNFLLWTMFTVSMKDQLDRSYVLQTDTIKQRSIFEDEQKAFRTSVAAFLSECELREENNRQMAWENQKQIARLEGLCQSIWEDLSFVDQVAIRRTTRRLDAMDQTIRENGQAIDAAYRLMGNKMQRPPKLDDPK